MLAAALLATAFETADGPPGKLPADERRLGDVVLRATHVPGRWEGNGLSPDTDGVAWYVGEVTLTALDAAGDLVRETIELRYVPKYPQENRWHIERWLPPSPALASRSCSWRIRCLWWWPQ